MEVNGNVVYVKTNSLSGLMHMLFNSEINYRDNDCNFTSGCQSIKLSHLLIFSSSNHSFLVTLVVLMDKV
jgi:plasmid rolling circle replication initiator protein Rep